MQSIEEIIDTKEYRDSIGTVDHSGKRVWINPKKPKGWFHNKRLIVAAVLLTVFLLPVGLDMPSKPMRHRFLIWYAAPPSRKGSEASFCYELLKASASHRRCRSLYARVFNKGENMYVFSVT
ncbi:MAG: hypothetical protein HC912_00430 [Saprospiraceae bacterium]|nr:hypothetical protein [Saprospiraceae bacterium]